MEEEKKEEHKHHERHVEHHKKIFHNKLNLKNIFVILAAVLLLILLANIFITFNLNHAMKKNAEELKLKLMPAKIQLAVINNPKCTDCFDIRPVVSYIKSQKVNVTDEKMLNFDSAEGKQLISQHKIEKIPSVIITGEIDKVNIKEMEKTLNALVFKIASPPYTNAANGNIIGRVTLYKIYDPNCEKCNDMSFWINQFKFSGIKIVVQKNITSSSGEGQEIIGKYNLDFVPVIILSKDAGAYDVVQKAWPQIGTRESDGSYVLTLVNPPFINLTTKEVRGIVNIKYLTDKGCTECYDVKTHKSILTNPGSFGMFIDKEETFDISDSKGKELLLEYNITQVPTIIIYGGVNDYPSSFGLKQFFSLEKDGSYIFRKLSVVGAYKELTTNTIVKPQQASQPQQS